MSKLQRHTVLYGGGGATAEVHVTCSRCGATRRSVRDQHGGTVVDPTIGRVVQPASGPGYSARLEVDFYTVADDKGA